MLAISIAGFFTSSEFKIVGLPILSCFIGIIAKIASRNKKHKDNSWNEWAIGLDLMLTAIILLITQSTDRFIELNRRAVDELSRDHLNNLVVEIEWSLLVLMIVMFFMTIVVRSRGWKNRDHLHWFWGVVLPDMVGLVLMTFVFYQY